MPTAPKLFTCYMWHSTSLLFLYFLIFSISGLHRCYIIFCVKDMQLYHYSLFEVCTFLKVLPDIFACYQCWYYLWDHPPALLPTCEEISAGSCTELGLNRIWLFGPVVNYNHWWPWWLRGEHMQCTTKSFICNYSNFLETVIICSNNKCIWYLTSILIVVVPWWSGVHINKHFVMQRILVWIRELSFWLGFAFRYIVGYEKYPTLQSPTWSLGWRYAIRFR